MKKIWKNGLAIIVPLLLGIGAGVGLRNFLYQQESSARAAVVEDTYDDQFDLHLPGEVEKRIITQSEVEAKLAEVGQLATYCGEYTATKEGDYPRYLLDDIRIPGTTNSIKVTCDGIVKVGYEVKDIIPTIDNDSQKIYIALPDPKILDNYLIWDTVQCDEKNNILNPIDFDQYQALLADIEQEGLTQVEESGIYEKAEKNAKVVIENFLNEFEEYEVKFL